MTDHPRNEQIRADLLDAVQADCSISDMSKLLGKTENYISTLLTELVNDGKLRRVSRGRYAIVLTAPPTVEASPNGVRPFTPHGNGNGNGHLAESVSRKVALPDYMRTRTAITLFVERSPEEIEGVMRLELNIGGAWIPLPVTADMRLCVGDDVPRWSATQEVYEGVKAYRVTKRDGNQAEYPHNPAAPLTIDRKVAP